VRAAPSAAERRWWWAAAVYFGLVLISLYPLQLVLDFLRARNLLRLSMASIFAACGLAAAAVLWRRRAGWREWSASALVGVGYLGIAAQMEIVQERLHLAEYGLLGLLLAGALAARRGGLTGGRDHAAVGGGALALAAGAGLVDELVQGALPNRQYDLRDVGFNAAAAALALVAAAGIERARRRDRGAGRP
jgi:hypothetical protein